MADDADGQPEPGQPNTARIRDRLLGDSRLEREVTELRATVDEMRDGFSRLSARMASAAGGDDDQPASLHLSDYPPDDLAARTVELEAWVETVLEPWHPTVGALLSERSCWPRHLDVLQQVHACALAMHGTHRAKGRRDVDPAQWLQRDLPALEKQVKAWLKANAGEFGDDSCLLHGKRAA